MRDLHTVLVSGYAKLPGSITAEAVFNTLVVVVIFDERSGVIVEAEASMVTELAKRFIKDLLVGNDLNAGPDSVIVEFERFYHGTAKKALETAIRMVYTRYQEYRESTKQ